jgi:hypothetical protein
VRGAVVRGQKRGNVDISAGMRGLGEAWPYYSKLFIDRMAGRIRKPAAKTIQRKHKLEL